MISQIVVGIMVQLLALCQRLFPSILALSLMQERSRASDLMAEKELADRHRVWRSALRQVIVRIGSLGE